MKNYSVAIALLLIVTACKQNKSPEPVITIDYKKEVLDVTTSIYPENLTKVFNAHGGIDAWETMKSLSFTMDKPDGKEVTLTNLHSREALIESPKATIGFDGNKAWFLNKMEGEYKGYPPKFYYNLMFYFYAMPFILSDDGINYADAEPLVFGGVTYPGIQVTYNAGVGETPEDRYVLYYNPETYLMEWLGYTVSFVPGIDKKELHFRKYGNWQEVNGLQLPKTITGYGFKNDKPTEAKATTNFIDIKVSSSAVDTKVFAKPEKGEFVE
ncbi:DUF6503 family protein [Lacinutrix sp. Bg11-31]|uniref:DUF6503 family protein n=1 Tax=Lacinutrix sp. Bg11-31 TaxID=2057808 RepID=UPI000C309665|nr:DUF6503 family protein [Lacinutrix sp. Bg11-31]AUC80853.1 hypothetical protein CW733_01370 [Lacinutrix sp. Bg11-31]